MSDYCVLCWSEKRERVAAVADAGDELLCSFHAKLAGWQEPEVLAVDPQSVCACGKHIHHKGRCKGLIRKMKPDPALTAVKKLRAENKSVRAIAEEIGVGHTTAGRLVQEAEGTMPENPKPDTVAIRVTAVQLDAFWNRLSLPEKARIVEGLL